MARPNYLGLIPAMKDNPVGQFPPQYIDCHKCGKGVLNFAGASGAVLFYRCDESECPYYKKQRTYQHGCFVGLYIMSPIYLHFEESGKGFADLADCIFMCKKCRRAKTGMYSKEATAGFKIETETKHDGRDDYQENSFICDACIETKAAPKGGKL